MAGMFGSAAYGVNPYSRFSALMGGSRNPFNPYGDDEENPANASPFIGRSPRNIPIVSQGYQAPNDPSYGRLGLGTQGVPQPSQYSAPGRRNPFYGPYISGGRVNPGQMTNWVAGRWPQGGQAPNPFSGNSVANVPDDGSPQGGPTARQQAVLTAFRQKNRINANTPRFPGLVNAPDRGPGGQDAPTQTHQIDPELGAKLFQNMKQRRAFARESSAAFRQMRASQQAQMPQADPNAAMQFAAANMMHPMMPGATQHNAAVMHMASQMHAANMQGAHQAGMLGLQQQQLHQQGQLAQQNNAFRQQQLAQQGQLGAAQLGLQFQQQNPGANVNQFMGGLGMGHPFGGPGTQGPPGGIPVQGMFPNALPQFDQAKLPGFLDSTVDLPDDQLLHHMQSQGISTTHLDRHIDANQTGPFFESRQSHAERHRRLNQAVRMRKLLGGPPRVPVMQGAPAPDIPFVNGPGM